MLLNSIGVCASEHHDRAGDQGHPGKRPVASSGHHECDAIAGTEAAARTMHWIGGCSAAVQIVGSMSQNAGSMLVSQDFQALLEAVVSLLQLPAALVTNGKSVVAMNADWISVTKPRSAPGRLTTIRECLDQFRGGDELLSALVERGTRSSGAMPVSIDAGAVDRREYIAKWRCVEMSSCGHAITVVVLAESNGNSDLESVIDSQRDRINHLLIRQTLIEENERRRLGRAMHDGIAQDLAHLRSLIARDLQHPMTARLISALDAVIKSVRTVTFELSPPVLEDLGIGPAIRWLAEHLGESYGAQIEVAGDAAEPRICASTRTIAFRAVRELAMNAVKHAERAQIELGWLVDEHVAHFFVYDNGPGFDAADTSDAMERPQRFGLLSIEQQIRGVGGTFGLVSEVGVGTRVDITVPLEGAPERVDE